MKLNKKNLNKNKVEIIKRRMRNKKINKKEKYICHSTICKSDNMKEAESVFPEINEPFIK